MTLLAFVCQNVSAQTDGDDPKNPDNLWDSVGIYHNQALAYVAQEAVGQPRTLSNYVGYANQFITNTFGARVENISSILLSASEVGTLLSDTATFFQNLIDNSNYSGNVKTYFSSLISTIKDTTDDRYIDYFYKKSGIVEIENNVLSDASLSQTEKDEILRVTSVARHSLFYWKNTIQGNLNGSVLKESEFTGSGPNGSEFNGGESLSAPKKKWWKWLIIGFCDVAGAISGGPTFFGAIAGAAGASSGAAAVIEFFEPSE